MIKLHHKYQWTIYYFGFQCTLPFLPFFFAYQYSFRVNGVNIYFLRMISSQGQSIIYADYLYVVSLGSIHEMEKLIDVLYGGETSRAINKIHPSRW